MDIKNLEKAMGEAERFLDTAQAVKEKVAKDKYAFFGCKETASCKRASMDLTRALVAIRKVVDNAIS